MLCGLLLSATIKNRCRIEAVRPFNLLLLHETGEKDEDGR